MNGRSSAVRVATDVGGTFTDLVYFYVDPATGRQEVVTAKADTTPPDFERGVLDVLAKGGVSLEAIESMAHGTTVVINALTERRGVRTALITTEGFRDVLEIARGNRPDFFNLHYVKPPPFVPRRLRRELPGRLTHDGRERHPLDLAPLPDIVADFRSQGVEAVAICLLGAYANPSHEQAVLARVRELWPEVSAVASHQIAREWREYERSSTAVLNAYIAPRVERYLRQLEDGLRSMDVPATLHVMQSNGGITTAAKARRQPIQTLLSGPVGGTIGGAALSRATGRPNLLCVDMGGTSFDLSLIVDGSPTVSTETELEGLPVLMPLVDIHTIGAGGGSIAWLEAGGLRVGPHSAGAMPGPACYGRGGTQPTVTDANLFLGRLAAQYFLGGRMSLDADAAQRALNTVATEIGLDDTAFAEGVLAIVNANMADAMRTITVKQGIDPRDYALVAFGGAGPMHAAWLAEELEIGEVIIPWSPGMFSAWGMLQTDMRHDVVRTFYAPVGDLEPAALQSTYDELAAEGNDLLAEEGIGDEDRYFSRSADMRYVGQEYTVSVPISGNGKGIDLDAIDAAFHDAHRVRYGHSTPGAPVEFVNLRLAAFGRIAAGAAPFRAPANDRAAHLDTAPAIFGGETHATSLLLRDALAPGAVVEGPAVIGEQGSTTVVPPGYRATVDPHGNLVMRSAQ